MPRRQPGQADVHHVCAIWCVHPDRVMGTVLSDQRTYTKRRSGKPDQGMAAGCQERIERIRKSLLGIFLLHTIQDTVDKTH